MTRLSTIETLASLATLRVLAIRQHGRAVANAIARGDLLTSEHVAQHARTLRNNLDHIDRCERKARDELAQETALCEAYDMHHAA